MLFEVLLEHDCIDKEPGWCGTLGRTILLNTDGLGTLCLTAKGVKGFIRMVLVWMKTTIELAARLGRVRAAGAQLI